MRELSAFVVLIKKWTDHLKKMWQSIVIEMYLLQIIILVIVIRSVYILKIRSIKNYSSCCVAVLIYDLLGIVVTVLPYPMMAVTLSVCYSLMIILFCYLHYIFCIYIFDKLRLWDFMQTKIFKFVFGIPLYVNIGFCLVTPFTALIFKINMFGELIFNRYYRYLTFINCCYLLSVIIYCQFKTMFYGNYEDINSAALNLLASSVLLVTSISTYYMQIDLFVPSIFLVLALTSMLIQESKIYIDSLTGLYNRNRCSKYLSSIIASRGRTSKNVYLAYIDIDDFKKINDNFGHLAGDLTLRTVGEAMSDIGSTYSAFVSRIGGDEFVIISSHKNTAEHNEMLDRLNETIEQKISISCPEFNVEYSIGTSQLGDKKVTVADVLKVADGNMYTNKVAKKKNKLLKSLNIDNKKNSKVD